MKKTRLNILCLLALTSYTYQSYGADVNPQKASSLNSYEFGELVKSYMPNIHNPTKWNYSTNSRNIIWDKNIEWNNYNKMYEKSGYIRINFDKYKLPESYYQNSKKVRSEAAWTVVYKGVSNKSVSEVVFHHGDTAAMISISENERIQPFNSLMKQGIIYKPVCLYKITGGNYSIAYELSVANKKDTYLIQSVSEGSGGLSTSYQLFYNKDDMSKDFKESHDLEYSSGNCLVL